MYKIILVITFLFSGCSHFTINGTMCDRVALDPHATMPKECRNYVQEEADKASKIPTQVLDSKDIIKFDGEE